MSILPWLDVFYPKVAPTMDRLGLQLTDDDLTSLFSLPKNLASACPYFQPESDINTILGGNENKFQVNLDVQQFTPKEIIVKVVEPDTIVVEAKHEEKSDDHGSIMRSFVRRYILPKEYDIKRVESRLSSDGILCITAPKIMETGQKERVIPVILTGKPMGKAVQVPKEDEKKEEEKKEEPKQ